MSFLEEVDTLRSKLHLSALPLPVRIGIIFVCAIVLFILFQGLWHLGSADAVLPNDSSQSPLLEDGGVVISSEEDPSGEVQDKESSLLAVHVVGEVQSPGMYRIAVDSRVSDAIEAAGGFTEDADQRSINLARVVEDGEQVVVASKTDATEANVPSVQDAQSSISSAATSGLVNLNTADITALCSLPGIGESTAKKIIADREKNGPFKTKKDITRVSGIGDKKYETIADLITV